MANDDQGNTEQYVAHGEALVAAVEERIGPWLRARIEDRAGRPLSEMAAGVEAAVDAACDRTIESLRTLVTADVDEPLSGPLERIRVAIAPLNETLTAAEVPQPRRDPFDTASRPDDLYSLGPMTFQDLGDEVHEAGITWGAAKAFLHRQRRDAANT